jgi:cysteine desulfurase
MTYGRPGVYLDHAATTPTDPSVVSAMVPWFTEKFGNPSSIYQLGQDSHAALDRARKQVGEVLETAHRNVLFTSGATESNNLAIRGAIDAFRRRHDAAEQPHVVMSAIEHHAVLDAVQQRSLDGVEVSVVSVNSDGVVDVEQLESSIQTNTCLITVMLANNEIGSIQPIRRIADIARARGVTMHTDAVQAAGMFDMSVESLGVDLLSLSAHKFYGPKGVGILFIRKGTPIEFQQHGGGQESGRRGGTENVPLIVGAADALVRADTLRDDYAEHCRALRDGLWERLQTWIPGLVRNGPTDSETAMPNLLSVVMPGVQGETLLLDLDLHGVAASAGSACTTGNAEPSHVLRAIGLDEAQCRSTIRVSVGRGNSMDEIDTAAMVISDSVSRLQQLGGVSARGAGVPAAVQA